jgi:hypothetical protein
VKNVEKGFRSHLLHDKGYLLSPWIITFHKEGQQNFMIELLYNEKHRREQSMVRIIFGILM